MPMMGVFNNLVLFDQHVPQNRIQSIVPDLATSWSSSEDGTELTFKLRHGVKWHDGKPFTSADVKCTFDLLQGKTQDKLRLNPRKAWYRNLDEVTPKGDDEVAFHLRRPQPYLLLLLPSAEPPVAKPELRWPVSLALDRKAFIDILVEGQGLSGATMQPPPDGVWGVRAEQLAELPGYNPDVAKNRAEARAIMEQLGYGPNKRLGVTVSTRNTARYRDPAVIAIDQMKEIYIDGTLEPIETANRVPEVIPKHYT